MSLLVIPDLHIGLIWDGCDRTEDVFAYLSQVKQYVKDRDVVFLGDIFDSPTVSHKYIARFINVLHEYNDAGCTHIYILRGNHDGEPTLKHGSPLQEVEAAGICSVVWHPVEIMNYFFVPHTTDPIEKRPLDKNNTLCFCHMDIPGAVPGIESEVGRGLVSMLPEWIIKGCKQVFAGHIHHVQSHGNIEVVGSALRVSTKEALELSRVLLVDDTGKFGSIIIDSRPMTSVKVVYGTPEGKELLNNLLTSDLTNQLVSVKITCVHTDAHKLDQVKLEEELRKRCHYLRFVFDVVKEKELRIKELDGSKSDIEVVKLFLDQQNASDKEAVLQCISEVLQ